MPNRGLGFRRFVPSWAPATDTGILNPGTSLEVIALRNGDWIMV